MTGSILNFAHLFFFYISERIYNSGKVITRMFSSLQQIIKKVKKTTNTSILSGIPYLSYLDSVSWPCFDISLTISNFNFLNLILSHWQSNLIKTISFLWYLPGSGRYRYQFIFTRPPPLHTIYIYSLFQKTCIFCLMTCANL